MTTEAMERWERCPLDLREAVCMFKLLVRAGCKGRDLSVGWLTWYTPPVAGVACHVSHNKSVIHPSPGESSYTDSKEENNRLLDETINAFNSLSQEERDEVCEHSVARQVVFQVYTRIVAMRLSEGSDCN